MVKYILPIALLFFALTGLQAQRPSATQAEGRLVRSSTSRTPLDCNDAGTIRFGQFVGQSNDITLDTVYLCFGDSLEILHDGNADFSGDPIPNTPSGIGYVFYDCRPTIAGPDLATILTDPCVNDTDPIISNGTPISQGSFNVWVATEQQNGNITFANDGFLQAAFNNGTPKPILFWFAPITLDDFATQGFENGGSCVDVSIQEAFAVVYLNRIQATDIITNGTATGCGGSFVITGGLPEFDALRRYRVDIALASDPSIKGRTENVLSHGNTIDFFVPQPGVYNITIEDGKSCSATFQVDMSACEAVSFQLPAVSALPGDKVCMDVTVQDFTDVASMQFSINWNPSILQFDEVRNFNPGLPGLGTDAFNQPTPGKLTFSWFEATSLGITLPDSASIFEICFDVIGAIGDLSLVEFSDDPLAIEIGDPNQVRLGFVGLNGVVSLGNSVLIPVLTQDSVSCPNTTDGSFQLTMFGGTPPYSFRYRTINPNGPLNGPFAINSSGGSFTVNNLTAARYEVTVNDSALPAANTVTDTIEVFRAPLIGISLLPTQPACFGDSTGAVRAVVDVEGVELTNPENQFTFSWNVPTAGNVSQLTNIPFGNYAVTITSADGCTATASLSLSQPPRINITENITNATCSGAENGAVSVSVTGGRTASGNYTFNWSSQATPIVATSSQQTNLNPGTYTLTVTDDNNCQAVETYIVGATKTLSIQIVDTSSVTCTGANDGQISVRGVTTGPGQALPYIFNWSGPGAVTPNNTPTESTIANLVAGTYILTMVDSDPQGCEVSATFNIVEPTPLSIALVEQINETCVVGNDGRIVVAVTGGVFPYTYAWSDGQTDSIAVNLSAGNYTLEVSDANNCRSIFDVTIMAPTPPTINPIQADTVSCPNSTDGTLTVTAVATGAPISGFSWSNGQSGQTITNLSPGTYFVTVTAQDGCTNVDSALVVSPGPVVLDSIVATAPTCPGFDNGRVTVYVSGGTAPYRYIWANTPANDTLTTNVYPGLTAGTYQVTVVDNNNCQPLTAAATVIDPPRIQITFSDIESTSCFENTCDGSATAAALYSDGTSGTFIFAWQSGEVESNVSSSTANQLCPGDQVVVATDANNCFGIDTVNIPSPPAINILVDVSPVTCFGFADGSITLNPSGGTPPFNFLWLETNETTETSSNLAAGVYNAVITDGNGCTKTQIVDLIEPAELQLTLDLANTTQSVTCNGDTDGIITVVFNATDPINPLGPMPFTWSGGVAPASAQQATNLAPGTYAVTITDVKGCTDTLSYTILNPAPIIAIIADPEDPRCFGESTLIVIDTVYGGVGASLFDYTYQVDNNGLLFTPDQPATVFAGTHIVSIEDLAGCVLSDTLEINQPAEIQVLFNPTEVEVELGDSTILQPAISASLPIQTFAWSPGEFLSATNIQNPQVNPLRSTDYTLTVTDVNGCTGVGTVLIDVDFNRNIYLPNVFSPNGDGPNDEFRIFACTGVDKIKSVRIFDRWGSLMFERGELLPECAGTPLWDGNFRSKPANPGVYVYMIEVAFKDGVELVYRGDVALVR